MPRRAKAATSSLTRTRSWAARALPSRILAGMCCIIRCWKPQVSNRRIAPDIHQTHQAEASMSAVPQFPAANDPDSIETQEWLDALEAVLEREGPERAHYLLEKLIDKARRSGAYIPFSPN